MNQDPWEAEKAFWATHPVARYDIEETSRGYDSYRDMVRDRDPSNLYGDWVRAEDFRAVVEALEKELRNVVP